MVTIPVDFRPVVILNVAMNVLQACKRRLIVSLIGLGCCGLILVNLRYCAPPCTKSNLVSKPSDDLHWSANVERSICEGGGFSTAIVDSVMLIQLDGSRREFYILGVDTAGKDADIPNVLWIGPKVLQIALSDNPFIKVITTKIVGLEITLIKKGDYR